MRQTFVYPALYRSFAVLCVCSNRQPARRHLLPPQGDSLSAYALALEPQLSSEERKMKWEQGQADYLGTDSFDNIKKKLDMFLK